MIRRTLTLMLVAGSIGGLAAGCGSSSKTPAPAGTSAAPASTSGAGTTGSGTNGATGATGAGGVNAAAVTACKNTINSHATLSASLKAKLLKLCNNITPANAKQVGKQICEEIVNTQLPSGTPAAIKNKALAACKKA
jgi:hypothetical protein